MENKALWQKAAVNALPLSLLPLLVDTIALFHQSSILSTILLIIKLAGVTTILYLFMKQFSANYDSISYSTSFKYGFALCLFSSIICTAVSALLYLVVAPDTLDTLLEAVNIAVEQYGGNVDIDQIARILPAAIICSTFLKCIFWGLVLSAVIANFTKNDNPF